MSSPIVALLAGTLLTSTFGGCTAANETGDMTPSAEPAVTQQKGGNAAAPSKQAAIPTEFVSVTDPVEKAFTMDMPKGWKNMAYLSRIHDTYRVVNTSVSPDGNTILFSGDPNLMNYTVPEAATEMHHMWADMNPLYEIAPFKKAIDYFPGYLKKKFGKLPDFKMVEIKDDAKLAGELQQGLQQMGMDSRVTAINATFTYTEGGTKMTVFFSGMTSIVPSIGLWSPEVAGISSNGDPKKFLDTVSKMGKTKKVNPQWQASQAAKAQASMNQIRQFGEQMTARHNQNMANIQASAQRHQARMQAIWDSNDASMKAYYDRNASSDVQHRNFLNYINDENTVQTTGGRIMQVDNSYQKYYLNKNNNTYVGGDSTTDLDTLRKWGLNPDDYEEAKIKTSR